MRIATLIVAMLSANANPVSAATYTVTTNSNKTFTPADLTVFLGDNVTFENAGGTHNVHADDNRFECAVNCSTNNMPSSSLWSHTVPFTLTGTFGYYCDAHGNLTSGMRGSITVLDDRLFADGFELLVP